MQGGIPIFIICRDRVTPLARLVAWLESAGHGPIVLIDNASTYPPLLDFFAHTRHSVVRMKENLGKESPWQSGAVETHAMGKPYVVTDADVVPIAECPSDAVAFFQRLLDRYPDYIKAGFGIRIDDLPGCYRHAEAARRWEQQFWHRRFDGALYHAGIASTFALYRPFEPGFKFDLGPSIRTGYPYLVRHMPWYADSLNPTAEETYYRQHATLGHWAREQLPENHRHPPRWSLYHWLRWRLHVVFLMKRRHAGSEATTRPS